MRSTISMMLVLGALALVGCGEPDPTPDGGHVGPGESCNDIIEACHSVDDGTGEIAVCHDLAHDGPVEMCDTRRDECVALCEAVGTDAGPPDACDMLGTLCHPYDTGSGPAHECHEIGHAGDVPACEAMLSACLTTCSGDAGAHGHDEDAGAHDAGEHGGH